MKTSKKCYTNPLILMLLFLAVLTSCNEREDKIKLSGSIFIVPEPGTNKPLGAVEVRRFDFIEFTQRFKEVLEQLKPSEASLNDDALKLKLLNEALDSVYAASHKLREINGELSALNKEFETMLAIEKDPQTPQHVRNQLSGVGYEYGVRFRRLLELQSAENQRLEPLKDRVREIHAKAKIAREKVARTEPQIIQKIFGELPPPISTTTTDANGDFTFEVGQNEKCVVVAYARISEAPDGLFFWAMPVGVGADQNKVILSNHNCARIDIDRHAGYSYQYLLLFDPIPPIPDGY